MTEMLHVRIKASERELYEAAAKADKRRLSDWVRIALLEVARSRVEAPELVEAVEAQVVRVR